MKIRNCALAMPVAFAAGTILSCIPACWDSLGGILGFRLLYYVLRYALIAKGNAVLLFLLITGGTLLFFLYRVIKAAQASLRPFIDLLLADAGLCFGLAIVLFSNKIGIGGKSWALGSVLELLFALAIIVWARKHNLLQRSPCREPRAGSGRRAFIKRLAAIVLALVFCIWAGSLLRCELQTYRYGEAFSEAYKANTMIGEQRYWKVLSYSDEKARVYFVEKDNSFGNILSFEKDETGWTYAGWDATVWSKTGSASEFVWPYIR